MNAQRFRAPCLEVHRVFSGSIQCMVDSRLRNRVLVTVVKRVASGASQTCLLRPRFAIYRLGDFLSPSQLCLPSVICGYLHITELSRGLNRIKHAEHLEGHWRHFKCSLNGGHCDVLAKPENSSTQPASKAWKTRNM